MLTINFETRSKTAWFLTLAELNIRIIELKEERRNSLSRNQITKEIKEKEELEKVIDTSILKSVSNNLELSLTENQWKTIYYIIHILKEKYFWEDDSIIRESARAMCKKINRDLERIGDAIYARLYED